MHFALCEKISLFVIFQILPVWIIAICVHIWLVVRNSRLSSLSLSWIISAVVLLYSVINNYLKILLYQYILLLLIKNFTSSLSNQFSMENFTNFFKWLKTLPLWIRAVILALLAVLSFFVSMGFTSCGTTRAVVHNGASGTSTEIKITTNNPTSVTASPNVELKHSNKADD